MWRLIRNSLIELSRSRMNSEVRRSRYLYTIIISCWCRLLSRSSLKKLTLGCISIVLFLPVRTLESPNSGLKLLKVCYIVISSGSISLFTQETLLKQFKDYVGSSLSSYLEATSVSIFMVKEY